MWNPTHSFSQPLHVWPWRQGDEYYGLPCLMRVTEQNKQTNIIFKPSSHPKSNSKNNLKSVHLSLPLLTLRPSKLPSFLLWTTVMPPALHCITVHQIFHFLFLQCLSLKGIQCSSVELRTDHINLIWTIKQG